MKSLDKLPLGGHPKSPRHSLVVPNGGCLERSAEIEVASPVLRLLQCGVVLEGEGWIRRHTGFQKDRGVRDLERRAGGESLLGPFRVVTDVLAVRAVQKHECSVEPLEMAGQIRP